MTEFILCLLGIFPWFPQYGCSQTKCTDKIVQKHLNMALLISHAKGTLGIALDYLVPVNFEHCQNFKLNIV